MATRVAAGRDLLEQFQLLSDHCRSQKGRAGDIPTGPSKAGDEPLTHRIANAGQDNRDRPSRLLGGDYVLRGGRHDDVNLATDQLGRQGRKPLVLSLRREVLDPDVPAVHVAEVSESLDKRPPKTRPSRVGERNIAQDTDPIHLPRLLRPGGEGCGE
jgi:hypothetical protein